MSLNPSPDKMLNISSSFNPIGGFFDQITRPFEVEKGFFHNVPIEPPNVVLGLANQCQNDPFPGKIDLIIGAYRDEDGKPVVLNSVRAAEQIIFDQKNDHEYLSQDGHSVFNRESQILMFGEGAKVIEEGRVYSIQGLSGTGSLRLGADFIFNFLNMATCYIPNTTWSNHAVILKSARVKCGNYRYLDDTGCNLDFDGLLEDIESFPEGSVILMHNCGHNPTGVDPTNDQWLQILSVIQRKKHLPFFDNAYQGFVSGSVHTDAFAVRTFADAGCEMLVASSFSKNFGLYGERVGSLHTVLSSASGIPAVSSQMRALSRAIYSTCPSHGALIVATVLSSPEYKKMWENDCLEMATRLNEVREMLYDAIIDKGVKGTWEHIKKQRGMFTYSGINKFAVERLRAKYHIYFLSNGRISLAGLNSKNIERFAAALADILGTIDEDEVNF